MPIKAVIAGVTGYTGQELLRYLLHHPEVEIIGFLSHSHAGKRLSSVGIYVPDYLDLEMEPLSSQVVRGADVVFSCLPHGESAQFVKSVLEENPSVKIVDLAADFRFPDAKLWESIYNKQHPFPGACEKAAYGIPEFNRDSIRKAQIVAGPGCYPTAFLLGAVPLVKAGYKGKVIFDAKSGISGAGKRAREENLFTELQDNIRPYSVFRHRHQAEMEFYTYKFTGNPLNVSFFPQVIPASRGILGTIYAYMKDGESVRSVFADTYCSEPFVRLLPEGKHPETSNVRGTNFAHIQIYTHPERELTAVTVVIDNLGKGASGQAVQIMNILFNLPETEGLESVPFRI